MNEFNNRIDAQREVLRAVNSATQKEALFGLSSKAIERWMLANQLDVGSDIAKLVRLAGSELFFLANKSQEQVTEEYRVRSLRVSEIVEQISTKLSLASR